MGENNLYDKELDVHYCRELQVGNTRILIVDPEITEDEKQRRLKQLSGTISRILGYKAEIIEKE